MKRLVSIIAAGVLALALVAPVSATQLCRQTWIVPHTGQPAPAFPCTIFVGH